MLAAYDSGYMKLLDWGLLTRKREEEKKSCIERKREVEKINRVTAADEYKTLRSPFLFSLTRSGMRAKIPESHESNQLMMKGRARKKFP